MMTKDSRKFYTLRSLHIFAALLVILAGLALRRFGYSIGLPFVIVKYGGSLLWGSMVYLLVVSIMPPEMKRRVTLCVAGGLAIAVELIRLVHFPSLDAFRATTAGALLLGSVFSLWNIACYLLGIGLAASFMTWVEKKSWPSAPASAP